MRVLVIRDVDTEVVVDTDVDFAVVVTVLVTVVVTICSGRGLGCTDSETAYFKSSFDLSK